MYDAVQILGSLLILTAFIAGITDRLSNTSYPYLVMNAIGSTTLAVEAAISVEWGFLLLEGVWAAVSLFSITRKAIRPTAAAESQQA
jgi:hypothetical protein